MTSREPWSLGPTAPRLAVRLGCCGHTTNAACAGLWFVQRAKRALTGSTQPELGKSMRVAIPMDAYA